jgi:hypothetical protein
MILIVGFVDTGRSSRKGPRVFVGPWRLDGPESGADWPLKEPHKRPDTVVLHWPGWIHVHTVKDQCEYKYEYAYEVYYGTEKISHLENKSDVQ